MKGKVQRVLVQGGSEEVQQVLLQVCSVEVQQVLLQVGSEEDTNLRTFGIRNCALSLYPLVRSDLHIGIFIFNSYFPLPGILTAQMYLI